MIKTKEQLIEFLQQDAKASRRYKIKPKLFGDDIWKFQYSMRQYDYHLNREKKNVFSKLSLLYWKSRNHYLSTKLGFTISIKAKIDKGFSIAHYGSVIINGSAEIGENCRIHDCVCIGANNGNSDAAKIGRNVFIATGAKIIGAVTIADDVAIGANAVVTKDILESGTTWGGIPAKLISHNNSHSNLSPMLDLNIINQNDCRE